MNWEERLHEAMLHEHNTIEDRRINGRTQTQTAATLTPKRSPLALYALSIGAALVLVAGVLVGLDRLGSDPAENVTVASDVTGSAAGAATATPTPEPTALPRATTAAPADAPPMPDSTPAPSPDSPCPQATEPGVMNVVNVALDDPDGGLVVHSAPGVSAPVTVVLPPWGTASATGGCAVIGESVWLELSVNADFPNSLGWANAFYLDRDTDRTEPSAGQPVSIAFGRDVGDGDGDGEGFERTETVTRWLSTSLASAEIPQAMLDQLELGPTDAEAAAGFSSELQRAEGTEGCRGGAKTEYVDQGGPDHVLVCVITAGIGADGRIASQIRATLSGFGPATLLTPEGDCFGDLSGENRCFGIEESGESSEATLSAGDCAAGVAPQGVHNVVGVALDDPDGGLVLHSSPGVSAPVTGVVPPWGSAFATGNCTLVDGAPWLELIAVESDEPRTPDWANAAYLDPDLARTGPADFPVLIAFARDQNSDNFAGHTETVTRYLSSALSSGQVRQAFFDQLERGPTAAEAAAGFSSILRDGAGADGCAGRKAEFVDRGGPDFVRVCIASAGVTTDLRVTAQIEGTFSANGRQVLPLLTAEGLCWGAVADAAFDCYEDGNGVLEADRYDFSQEEGSSPSIGPIAFVDHDVWFTPDTDSANDHVRDVSVSFDTGCPAVTIEMGEGWTDTQTSTASDEVRGGIGIGGGRGEAVIVFGDWFNVDSFFEPQSVSWAENGFAGSAVLVAGRGENPDFVRIANQSSGAGSVELLSNPARIVINMPCADGSFPEVANEAVVVDELVATADGATVRGFGVAFESIAVASVTTSDGVPVPTAVLRSTLPRSPSLTDDTQPSMGSLQFVTGSLSVAWGEFNLEVSALAPGNYRLVLGDSGNPGDGFGIPFTVSG